jgi:hypothetical protein
VFGETWETNGSLPEPVEACRNCHVPQAPFKGVVGGRVADALRAGSDYGRPSREAVRLSGQTLLRVQRNELKIANKI